MKIACLSFWIGVNLVMQVIEMKNVEYRYFSSGENITLNCNSEVLYWYGPSVNIEKTANKNTFVEITGKNNKTKNWSISIYTKGDTVKDTLPQHLFKRLNLIGDNFDLLITNLSASEEGLYICEPKNNTVLQKQYLLRNKYKLSINVNVDDSLIVEGETTQLCCTSRGRSKPTSIWLSKEDKQLNSTKSGYTLCYKMRNVSRNDTGNYTCSSQNEIGNASTEIYVVISYPPVVNVRTNISIGDGMIREIQCMAQGEPDNVTYFRWEHRSLSNEHIRYLGLTNDGILQLPEIQESRRYQNTGFYICNVSNGISDYHGNVFQQGRNYIEFKGPPVFATNNKQIIDSNKESTIEVKVNVYSSTEIKCHNVTEVDRVSIPLRVIDFQKRPIRFKQKFFDALITLNGTEISFLLHGLNDGGYHIFNVTVCNSYGTNSFVVEVEEKPLSPEGISITIIVCLIIIVAGMSTYIGYLKLVYRKRLITSITVQTPERNDDGSAHYADITEDDNNTLNLRQGNNDQSISLADIIHVVGEHRDITNVSEDHSSTISANDVNGSEIVDDGYEKPYSTLMIIDRDKDEHMYLSTRNSLTNITNEHSTSLDHAACGYSSGFTKLHYIPHITKSDDLEYINLSLKQ